MLQEFVDPKEKSGEVRTVRLDGSVFVKEEASGARRARGVGRARSLGERRRGHRSSGSRSISHDLAGVGLVAVGDVGCS